MFDIDDLMIKPNKSLELTSMIDIIFILLIFFMVTTTFSKVGIAIEIPKAKYISQTQPETVEIFINKEGQAFYQQDLLSESALKQLVSGAVSTDDKVVVVLNPDEATSTQALLTVMDWCKDAKATHFSIAAQKKE